MHNVKSKQLTQLFIHFEVIQFKLWICPTNLIFDLRTSCTSYTDVFIVCKTIMDPKTLMPAFTQVTLQSRAKHVTQPYRSVALSKLSTFKSLSIVMWKSKLTAYNFGHIGTPSTTYCAPNVVEQYFYSSLSWIATTNESYLKGTWGFWQGWNTLKVLSRFS